MTEKEAKAMAKEFSAIALWSTNIDAQTMWLTKTILEKMGRRDSACAFSDAGLVEAGSRI
jgi:hypothetical protein